jgi:hypothetical protein
MNTITVIDNYAKSPERLQSEAKQLKYTRSKLNLSNLISEKSKYANAVYRRLIAFNKRKISWDIASGTYRKTTQKEVIQYKNKTFVHSDGITDFIALLYLNDPKDCHGGTGFYRHKKTGLEGFHDLNTVEKAMRKLNISFNELVKMTEDDARMPGEWELTDKIQMKYNRMVIYNGRMFHSHIFDFAKVKSNSTRVTMAFYGTSV